MFALQFAVAAGANVYVTSSSPEKIKKAIELGAKGGVNYKDRKWHVNVEKRKLTNTSIMQLMLVLSSRSFLMVPRFLL